MLKVSGNHTLTPFNKLATKLCQGKMKIWWDRSLALLPFPNRACMNTKMLREFGLRELHELAP